MKPHKKKHVFKPHQIAFYWFNPLGDGSKLEFTSLVAPAILGDRLGTVGF
jgi:hypothetical protein